MAYSLLNISINLLLLMFCSRVSNNTPVATRSYYITFVTIQGKIKAAKRIFLEEMGVLRGTRSGGFKLTPREDIELTRQKGAQEPHIQYHSGVPPENSQYQRQGWKVHVKFIVIFSVFLIYSTRSPFPETNQQDPICFYLW